MNKRTRPLFGLCLAGGAAFMVAVLRTGDTPEVLAKPGPSPSVNLPAVGAPMVADAGAPMVADAGAPMVADAGSLQLSAEAESLLPAPSLPNGPFAGLNTRPAEESMLSSWASRDPEGAGRWLSRNRQHPKFADMVRGYAIQISTIDPAAARKWAAELEGKDNRFAHGGTLEQHIDAVEAMLNGTSAPEKGNLHPTAAGFAAADYTPVLVRQHPDEPPVLQMQPTSFT